MSCKFGCHSLRNTGARIKWTRFQLLIIRYSTRKPLPRSGPKKLLASVLDLRIRFNGNSLLRKVEYPMDTIRKMKLKNRFRRYGTENREIEDLLREYSEI
eukprot:GHVP01066535.1.p2 GENE.GHVP01066535.1~~GHVP01066535.1.p2  ORF type:complete len:100 (+),score=12.70 GHVP01066535.1:130-429(+)